VIGAFQSLSLFCLGTSWKCFTFDEKYYGTKPLRKDLFLEFFRSVSVYFQQTVSSWFYRKVHCTPMSQENATIKPSSINHRHKSMCTYNPTCQRATTTLIWSVIGSLVRHSCHNRRLPFENNKKLYSDKITNCVLHCYKMWRVVRFILAAEIRTNNRIKC